MQQGKIDTRSPSSGKPDAGEAPGCRNIMSAHPVPDLRAFLLGAWRLTRLGWIDGPVRVMRLVGTARFSPRASDLAFEERGTMAFGAFAGDSVKRLMFHLAGDGAAEISFEDGAPFHRVDLSRGRADVRHECGPDLYEGRYRVLGPDLWTLNWRVTGPRKRHLIASRFVRTR
jgi:hypothetical protein